MSTPPHSPELLDRLQTISDAWLTTGGHDERGFALGYFDRSYLDTCEIHYLINGAGEPVAFVNILPQFRTHTITTIDLLRFLPNQNGTMPYLLCMTIFDIHSRGESQKFDLGFVPFAATDSRLIRIAKLLGGKRFSAKGLEQFKNKFDPTWEPNYIAYSGDFADLTLIAANLEKAMRIVQ